MKDPDKTIERVLGGLGDVEAPEGLERRVLRAIAEGAEHRAGHRSGRHWSWAPALSWMACGGVALTMLAVSLVVARLHGSSGTQSPVVAARRPAIDLPALPMSGSRVMRVAGMRHAPKRPEQERGFPAPPMPLTEQERLLVRLAHRGDPVEEMAMLNPEARARREVQSDAEFNSFFPPALKTEVENQSSIDEKGESQ